MRLPAPEPEVSGLLCVPLPWEEGDRIEAAAMIFESQALAQAGLDHYVARVGAVKGFGSPYRLLPLRPRDLIQILETRPESGFDHVAINPILSRHFPEADGYSAGLSTEEFVEVLKDKLSVG